MGQGGAGAAGGFGEKDDWTTGLPDTGEVEAEAAGAVPRFVDGDDGGAMGETRGEKRAGEMGGEGVDVEDAGSFAEEGGEAAHEGYSGPRNGKNGGDAGCPVASEEGNDFDRETLSGGRSFETTCAREEEQRVFKSGVEVAKVLEGAKGGARAFVPRGERAETGGVHGATSAGQWQGRNRALARRKRAWTQMGWKDESVRFADMDFRCRKATQTVWGVSIDDSTWDKDGLQSGGVSARLYGMNGHGPRGQTDILLLSNMANSYFFPGLPNMQYVFARQDRRFLTLAKIVRELGLPGFHRFYGKWADSLERYGTVVIFDAGYQPKMERFIWKRNPSARIHYFNWNPLDNRRKIRKALGFSDRNEVYCTDSEDCRKYGLKFADIFYSSAWAERVEKCRGKNRGDCIWLGQNKGRALAFERLEAALQKIGVATDIRLVDGGGKFLPSPRMTYFEYCKWVVNSGCLLDINQATQSASTLRVMEAIFFQKKLVTGNRTLAGRPFYNPANILIVDPLNPDADELRAFFDAEFVPYPPEVQRHFDYPAWVGRFGQGTSASESQR